MSSKHDRHEGGNAWGVAWGMNPCEVEVLTATDPTI